MKRLYIVLALLLMAALLTGGLSYAHLPWVPLVNLGWAPGFTGGQGQVQYTGVKDTFAATLKVEGLKANYTYKVFVMGVGVDGSSKMDDTSFSFTTDAKGVGATQVSLDLPGDIKPLPAYQVHVLVVDGATALQEPLPNPLGIGFAIPLACNFPLGFRVGS